MDWFRPIDAYCERTDASYWSEPVNAISNLAFIIAAIALGKAAKSDWKVGILTLLIALIGVGSYLFHTHANPWSGLLDSLFIILFLHLYLLLILRYSLKLSWWRVGLGLALFILLNVALSNLTGRIFNGSISYVPAWLTLLGMGIYFRAQYLKGANALLLAAGVFFCSLIARSLDMELCNLFPLGLHFIWHILNAVVLYVLVKVLVINNTSLT